MTHGSSEIIKLPAPRKKSEVSIEEAIERRRSVRDYTDDAIGLPDLAQLLWAAQGITGSGAGRAAPSAGATYPLEVYALVRHVTGLASGMYKYRPAAHELARTYEGDLFEKLTTACLGQDCVREAAAVIALAAVHERTTDVYGNRGTRYVDNEVGHVAENIHLQAVALGLGTVAVGAFNDRAVGTALRLGEEEKVMYLVPVGRPR
jgi:SagB-type dehydrogenase family enzyme